MESTANPTSSSSAPTANRPAVDVLSETFPTFDHRAQLATPFDEESKRDAEFAEKLNSMLLELILDFHAWAAARPMHESERTADALEKEAKLLEAVEKEQEATRQRLSDFITQIKIALAALTGLAH